MSIEEAIDGLLKKLPPEQRLKGLSPEERLRGLSAEERVRGLSAEERVRLLLASLDTTEVPPQLRQQMSELLRSAKPRG